MTVRKKLIEFYNTNNLKVNGGVYEDWNTFKISFFSFKLPNLHKKGYLLHDINHLICEYGIDWFSEFETAAWELGSGGRKGFGLSWVYPVVGAVLGMLLIPKKTIVAFKKGLQCKNAHILSKNYDVFEMDLEELKRLSFSME